MRWQSDPAQLPRRHPDSVKDNIDAAGLTTAACPAFPPIGPRATRRRSQDCAAGAIVIGKTNLDQFATGLVGVRSPYGISATDARRLIPGGSARSAVAVSAGLVPLALGTDTVGSGRVPAMLNIRRAEAELGLISTSGVVPARTLDCVSIFSLNVDDAMTALAAMAAPDAADPYCAIIAGADDRVSNTARLGVPRDGQLIFWRQGCRAGPWRRVATLTALGQSGRVRSRAVL
jgi:allophanate hydrolase